MSLNRYAYANNNPYKFVDPDGQFIQLVILGARACASNFACRSMVVTSAKQLISIAANAVQETQPKKKRKRYFSKKKKKERFDEVDGKCEYCGKDTQLDEPFKPNSAEGEHIDPQANGGETNEENQANACRECNADKSDKILGVEWDPPNPNERIKDKIKKNQEKANGN